MNSWRALYWRGYGIHSQITIIGDKLRAPTFRKVVTEGSTGTRTSTKVRLTLTLDIEDIEYDHEGCKLRVKGRNIEENEHVKLGAYHTIGKRNF